MNIAVIQQQQRQTPALEAETDRLLFSASLADFLAAAAAQSPPGLDWSTDGCTSAPDDPFGFDFEPACVRHDFGYRNYKAQGRFDDMPGGTKAAIDTNFRQDLYGQCAAEGARDICEATADVYYEAVVLFGRKGGEAAAAAAEAVTVTETGTE
ncbi:hypothetical protein SLS62_000356 [Diatrype stigma]|uniref:Phospholipase A2 n=1 Tax=Diatrype stigma TaxID=117547 RepID=A0AAN9UXD6_9PEZI